MTVAEKNLVDHLVLELEHGNKSFQLLLQRIYPQLTPYDLRLCTYLKANLSTKEIAHILNITPDSVKKAKHRLRKKLAFSSYDSWTQFFARP